MIERGYQPNLQQEKQETGIYDTESHVIRYVE